MCKQKNSDEMKTEEVKFPHYLSNKPEGEDLFDGKSQERLAKAMAKHIYETDAAKEPFVSRLLGLEGKWGSGKSNVIGLLRKELSEKYTFFCFDAWGNQEDLQRRSILELLTKDLIPTKLTGLPKMKVLSPEDNGKIINKECSWEEKLESLTSRKSYSKNITVPSVNNWTKAFVLLLLVTGLLIPLIDVVDRNNCLCWWAVLLIVLLPIMVFLIIALCKGKLGGMWAMYNTDSKSDTTSFVISEQEPSVREFKDWMKEISDGIPDGDRLILVFDNMDRLPTDKVHQFWSLIQTFFADSGYSNIWCVIPYDEVHLATAFTDESVDDRKVKLLRAYLDKTFPIVFRVPEPIVSDYKVVFSKLLDKAFSDTIAEEDKEIISRCYRHDRPEPNVREIISFINEMVSLTNQWGAEIHPITMAIFALKADDILRNPIIEKTGPKQTESKKVSTEEFILSQGYLVSFKQILFGSESIKYLPREISALVYGVKPEDALQIVIRRYIRNCFTGIEGNPVINKYVDNSQFMTMLEEEVHDAEITTYYTTVKLIGQIDKDKLTAEGKIVLAKIWKFFGNRYVVQKGKFLKFADYEQILFSHVSHTLAENCSTTFCKGIIENKDVNGGDLFAQLEKLFRCEFAAKFDINKICPASEIGPKRFLDYVSRAGDEYRKYPLTAKNSDVVKVLKESIGDEFPYYDTLLYLKDDANYTVKEVDDYAVSTLNEKHVSASFAYQLISVQRVFHDKLQSESDATYIQKLWQEVQAAKDKPQYDEIYAWKAATSLDQLPEDERHVGLLKRKALFYTSTAKLLKDVVANKSYNYRNLTVKKMIEEKIHDGKVDYSEFIENWTNLVNILAVSKEDMVAFADSWGMKEIPEAAKAKSYFTLLADVAWIDTLLTSETEIAKKLLEKCVSEMTQQDVSQFIQSNTATRTTNNWGKALQKLIGTKYLKTANLGKLNNVAETLLDYAARNGAFNDETWNQLFEKVKFASISTAVNEIRRKILNNQSGYVMTSDKFKMLHSWLEKAEMNSAERCTDAANFVLSKIVDDSDCQGIILANKEYYRPIIEKTTETASALHDKLKKIIAGQGESEFAQYVKGIVKYEEENKDSDNK